MVGKLTRLGEKGRIVLPKKLREELKLRVGQRLIVKKKANEIVLKPVRDVSAIMSELRGCIKEPSKLKPMDVKKIWEKNI